MTSKDVPTTALTDFLLARIAEDEEVARSAEEQAQTPWRATYGRQVETSRDGYLVTPEDEHSYMTDPPDEVALHIARHDPARVLAECEAKRRIVEWHKSWPVLSQTPPTFKPVDSDDPSSFAMRASQQMAWLTEQEYRDRFGSEPPTGPVLRFLALTYADHPDYREEWRP